jgi:HAMP domain-containing protein
MANADKKITSKTEEIEELRAEVARLRDELDEAEEIIKRMMFEGV